MNTDTHEHVRLFAEWADPVGFRRAGSVGDFSTLHTISLDSKGNLIAGRTIDGRRVKRFLTLLRVAVT